MKKIAKDTKKHKAITREGTVFDGVSCYVLDDGSRVMTKTTVVQALSGSASAKDAQLERYIDRLPNGSELLADQPNIDFVLPHGGTAQGVKASTVARMLRLYVEAWGVGALRANQIPVAQRAATMLAQLAEVGIVALIDEATGYQEKRPKDELNRRLLDMIRAELDDVDPVYKPLLVALAKLKKVPYFGQGTPPAWAPAVANICTLCTFGEEGRLKLREFNPNPNWAHRDPMHLDDKGKKLLLRTLGIAEAYAHTAKTYDHWIEQMNAYFRGHPIQEWMF